ncbi:Sphingosine N-acyltransferase lag1 [Rhizina undulata]
MHTPVSDDDRSDYGRSSALGSNKHATANDSLNRGVKGSDARRRVVADGGKDTTPKPKRQRSMSGDRLLKVGVLDQMAAYMVDNQIRFSIILLSALSFTYAFLPQYRHVSQKFFRVSYYNPVTELYGKGTDDIYLVFFWIVVFTFLRAVAVEYVFIPYAKRGGVQTQKGLVRFAEQAWLFVYYSGFWTLGMYLMYQGPYWMSLPKMWQDWPVRELGGLFKWYYLVQFAFWLQQIFVLNIEEKRKDYYQMFAHHIITCTLMYTSYTIHLTRPGNSILCVMDIVDILLPLAKMLKYLGYHTTCDYAFGIFLITWFVGRHVFYMLIVHSCWRDSPVEIPFGCYSSEGFKPVDSIKPGDVDFYRPFTQITDEVCYTGSIQMVFITFLSALQVLTLIWFYMIIRVAVKVIKGGEAEDVRSDDEGEDEDESEDEAKVTKEKRKKSGTNSMTSPSLPSVIMNGHSHRHLGSQPLGGG